VNIRNALAMQGLVDSARMHEIFDAREEAQGDPVHENPVASLLRAHAQSQLLLEDVKQV
jgi:hypothetical protein